MKSSASKSTVRLFLGTRRPRSIGNWDREREDDHLDASLWNRALNGLRTDRFGSDRVRKV